MGLLSLDYLIFGNKPYMVFGGCKKELVAGSTVSVPILFAVDYDTLAIHRDFDVTLTSIAIASPGANMCVEQVIAYNAFSTGKVFAVINFINAAYDFVATPYITVAYADPGSTGSVVSGCTSKVALLSIETDTIKLRKFGWMGMF